MNKITITKEKKPIAFQNTAAALMIGVLCLFNLGQLNAQLLIGPKIGARMSWLKYEDFAEDEFKKTPFFGYNAGITTAFKVQKRFSIQLDIMYSKSGKKIDGISDPSLQNYAKYHYLNTPVVYRLDFIESFGNRSFKYYLGVGPNVNFWLGGNGVLKSVELIEENIEQLNYNIIFDNTPANPEFGGLYVAEPNKVQVGLIFSTGLVLEPNPGQSILIDFRYEWGHSYMAREPGRFADVISYTDDLRARNQAFQISIAYVFDIINKGEKEKNIYYKNK